VISDPIRIRIGSSEPMTRVADPYSFDTDPDPAFKAEYRSGSNPESGVLMTKNCKKFAAEKKFNLFLIKNYSLPIPRPP
jgi:hypothetical protein